MVESKIVEGSSKGRIPCMVLDALTPQLASALLLMNYEPLSSLAPLWESHPSFQNSDEFSWIDLQP